MHALSFLFLMLILTITHIHASENNVPIPLLPSHTNTSPTEQMPPFLCLYTSKVKNFYRNNINEPLLEYATKYPTSRGNLFNAIRILSVQTTTAVPWSLWFQSPTRAYAQRTLNKQVEQFNARLKQGDSDLGITLEEAQNIYSPIYKAHCQYAAMTKEIESFSKELTAYHTGIKELIDAGIIRVLDKQQALNFLCDSPQGFNRHIKKKLDDDTTNLFNATQMTDVERKPEISRQTIQANPRTLLNMLIQYPFFPAHLAALHRLIPLHEFFTNIATQSKSPFTLEMFFAEEKVPTPLAQRFFALLTTTYATKPEKYIPMPAVTISNSGNLSGSGTPTASSHIQRQGSRSESHLPTPKNPAQDTLQLTKPTRRSSSNISRLQNPQSASSIESPTLSAPSVFEIGISPQKGAYAGTVTEKEFKEKPVHYLNESFKYEDIKGSLKYLNTIVSLKDLNKELASNHSSLIHILIDAFPELQASHFKNILSTLQQDYEIVLPEDCIEYALKDSQTYKVIAILQSHGAPLETSQKAKAKQLIPSSVPYSYISDSKQVSPQQSVSMSTTSTSSSGCIKDVVH